MPILKIRVKGVIHPSMADWFEGFKIESSTNNESCLSGPVIDSSAIYGLFSTLSSLGITLVSAVVTETNDK
jgi:hypothetical protein